MKTSRTPKIVIGIGLVAVYAAIGSVLMLRDGRHDVVAQSAPSVPGPLSVPTPLVEPGATDPALSAAVMPASTDPVTAAPEQSVATPVPTAPAQDSTPKNVAATASSSIDTDSRITAEVKSEVAAVDPDGNIEVATRDGVVALTGSVPSQDVIDKVWLVARNVPSVKNVDVSALMILD